MFALLHLGKAVLYLQYYIYFYVTKSTQMLISELPVKCLSLACTWTCRIGSVVPKGVYCQNIQCKKWQFPGYCLSLSLKSYVCDLFDHTVNAIEKRMYCRIDHLKMISI